MVKSDLMQYIPLMREADRIRERIIRLEARMVTARTSSLTCMPRSGRGNDIADLIAMADELGHSYSAKLAEAIRAQMRVEEAIAGLTVPVERDIMRLRYIDGLRWEAICVKINYSWKQVHRYARRATQRICPDKKDDTL